MQTFGALQEPCVVQLKRPLSPPPRSSPPLTSLPPHTAFLAWSTEFYFQAPELADPAAHSASPAGAPWLALSDTGLRRGFLALPVQ